MMMRLHASACFRGVQNAKFVVTKFYASWSRNHMLLDVAVFADIKYGVHISTYDKQ